MKFSELVKSFRLRRRLSLRQFCLETAWDPSNWSRIERGMSLPPNEESSLNQIAEVLGLTDSERTELTDSAAIDRRELPADIVKDPRISALLPAFFRAARGTELSPAQFELLMAKVTEMNTPDWKK